MLINVGDFSWGFNHSGYEWLTQNGVDYLAPKGAAGRIEPYAPMENENLFYRLAKKTPTTRQGILEFANKFGLLDGSTTDNERGDFQSRLVDEKLISLNQWVSEINQLSEAVTLWDQYRAHGGTSPIARPKPQIPSNKQASTPVSHELSELLMTGLFEGLGSVATTHRDGSISISVRPRTLKAALWLQLSMAVEGGSWKNCVHCDDPFEYKREDAQYCGDPCRQAAYEKRRKAKGAVK